LLGCVEGVRLDSNAKEGGGCPGPLVYSDPRPVCGEVVTLEGAEHKESQEQVAGGVKGGCCISQGEKGKAHPRWEWREEYARDEKQMVCTMALCYIAQTVPPSMGSKNTHFRRGWEKTE